MVLGKGQYFLRIQLDSELCVSKECTFQVCHGVQEKLFSKVDILLSLCSVVDGIPTALNPSGHLVVPDFFSLNSWYDVISHSHLNLPSHLNLLRSNVVDIFFILMSYLCLLFGKIPNSTFTF